VSSRRSYSGHDDRDRDAAPAAPSTALVARESNDGAQDGQRKRKSRWGDKTTLAGLPTAISSNVKAQELDNYATSLRLEELNRKLRTGDIIPADRER
jgi:splicing factor 1